MASYKSSLKTKYVKQKLQNINEKQAIIKKKFDSKQHMRLLEYST